MSRGSAGEEDRPGAPRRGPARAPLIVIGCSWGGLAALQVILADLPADLPAAVAIVQHRQAAADDAPLVALLARGAALPVRPVDDKDPIVPGNVFVAPPNYHLLVDEGCFALSIDEAVMYSRPSIDVLFESAARTYGRDVIGVLLTGANADGAHGLAEIRRCGGHGIVQDPATAEHPVMPRAAIDAGGADEVLPLNEISRALVRLCATGVGAGARAAGATRAALRSGR